MRPPPREHLDPRARTLWRITGLLQAAPVIASAIAGVIVVQRFDLFSTPLAVLIATLLILLAASGVWPYPDILWRQWRYEIGDTEVDLQSGLWTVRRTLLPMARIQHVDTRRGPLQRRFGLASVILYTAAGASEIPALSDEVAASARDRIAALANVYDDL